MFCLMGAVQAAFVTFGSWLEDDHGFNAGALSAVAFALGVGELLASASTVRFTDRLGKRRAVILGAAMMIPAGAALAAVGEGRLTLGLPLLALYVIGFEFAVVSALSLASNLIPGRPGSGIGLMVGAGTLGRAAIAVIATRLYDDHGFAVPIALGTVLAVCCVSILAVSRQLK